MEGFRLSYLKLTALVAVAAIVLAGLSELLSMTAIAQERRTEKREIDLRDKLKNKKFTDGRRVEVHAFSDGIKIIAEIKNGEFLNWFLVTADGTEVKGEVKNKNATTTTTPTCFTTVPLFVPRKVNGQTIILVITIVVTIPCTGNSTGTGTTT